jgi:transcriptional regulator with XRE-family HTH domain
MPCVIKGMDARLNETLQRLGINRRQAAAMCGCTSKQMSSWCCGNPMGVNSLKSICDGLGVSSDYLLGISPKS